RGISTQMAARELRYNWFEELLALNSYSGLLLAHHADDQLETVLLNMLRGTGIEGFYGMGETRGQIIRPLLPFHRTEIHDFALMNNMDWREDSSNSQIEYKRNFLRHRIVPELRNFDQGAAEILQYSFDRIKDTGKAFFYLFDSWLENNLQKDGDFQYINIERFSKASGQRTLLYYWLQSFGFNFMQISDLYRSMKKQ